MNKPCVDMENSQSYMCQLNAVLFYLYEQIEFPLLEADTLYSVVIQKYRFMDILKHGL